MLNKVDVLYHFLDKPLHPIIPMMESSCKRHNVDLYLIAAIFKFEIGKHPRLLTQYNNPGNIKTEESQFMLPIQFDSMECGIDRYVRLMRQVVEREIIYNPVDVCKLVRPIEPEWGDQVSENYKDIIKLSKEI